MLQISNLSKTYGERQVLCNLNLHVSAGEVYGLLGPNGAGKTTTINILCNLLTIDSGQVRIADRLISDATKCLIGVVPQENLVYRNLTCAENLNFFGQIYGLRRRERQQRIRDCLMAVNLMDRAHSLAETLSGGMQRRLNIAIALVHYPKLLILDEPTTGLDVEARYEIWELIRNLQQEGMTVLLTTHLLEEAERLCQRIGILKKGQIVAEGTIAQLSAKMPAREIITIHTTQEKRAIQIASAQGLCHCLHGKDLAFWLPAHMELKEILELFEDIELDSIARVPVRLEHIYLELTN